MQKCAGTLESVHRSPGHRWAELSIARVLLLTGALVTQAQAQQPEPAFVRQPNLSCTAPERPSSATSIVLVPVATITAPVVMVQDPAERWFALNRTGTLTRFQDGPTFVNLGVALDLSARVTTTYLGNNAEFGALGFALHPEFAANGHAYIFYTTFDGRDEIRVSRFTSANGATFDPQSEQILLELPLTTGIHIGGNIEFGPDGYLYIGTGDGGVASPGGAGNSQNRFSLMGKMLRLDVDNGAPYGIPADNPFADGVGGAPEVYAWGLRNPFRWSFDAPTGDLWLGDVGHNGFEEVNLIQKGGNYGWPIVEGTACWQRASCDTADLIEPLYAYPHEAGSNAIIGGGVYRGQTIPNLAGTYIFADRYQGIHALRWDEAGQPYREFLSAWGPYGFAQGRDGSYYTLLHSGMRRLDPATPPLPIDFPNRLSETGCFDPQDPRQPAPGLIPYTVNAPLWSDNADKERFLAIPDGSSVIIGADHDWDLPTGSVLTKTFSLGDRLVETRLFVRHADGGWAGYSYEWNDEQTDAELLPSSKVQDIDGQSWRFPGRNECLQCHTDAAGRTLGLETAQLNGDFRYPASGVVANQIETLAGIGLFAANPGPPASLPRLAEPFGAASVDLRARAYLHANCAMCHRPGGPGQGPPDFRHEIPGTAMGILGVGPTQGNMGISQPLLLAPGQPHRSVIAARLATRDIGQMPPLASSLVDHNAVLLIDEWIRSGLGFGIPDTDQDGFADNVDNCTLMTNPSQYDSDGDGYGNACDADLDNNGIVNFSDLAIFRSRFGTADPAADLNGDGIVNFADLARFRALFGMPPGPAAPVP